MVAPGTGPASAPGPGPALGRPGGHRKEFRWPSPVIEVKVADIRGGAQHGGAPPP